MAGGMVDVGVDRSLTITASTGQNAEAYFLPHWHRIADAEELSHAQGLIIGSSMVRKWFH